MDVTIIIVIHTHTTLDTRSSEKGIELSLNRLPLFEEIAVWNVRQVEVLRSLSIPEARQLHRRFIHGSYIAVLPGSHLQRQSDRGLPLHER